MPTPERGGRSPQEYHPPVEEYLETMLALGEEGVPVIQARIAERLGRSAPSVSEMLDRLIDEGYVRREGRRLDLTDSGRALAEKVVRKHRLAERLLVDVIGLEWHKVHREAGRWEHVISDDVEARLVELLGDPATCPHGNPIPGARTVAPAVATRPLADVDEGERVRLVRISEEVETNLGSLTLLDEGGFIPGAVARVGGRSPDGAVEVAVEGAADAIQVSRDLSGRLFVGAP
jgi:DtxR family transcriptional regulator, iron-dependent repressor